MKAHWLGHNNHHKRQLPIEPYVRSRNYLWFLFCKMLHLYSQGSPLVRLLQLCLISCKMHSCIHCLDHSNHCNTCNQYSINLHSNISPNLPALLFFLDHFSLLQLYLEESVRTESINLQIHLILFPAPLPSNYRKEPRVSFDESQRYA